jgi:hypothetical protein
MNNLRLALLNLVDRLDEGVELKLVEGWVCDLADDIRRRPEPTQFPARVPVTSDGAL